MGFIFRAVLVLCFVAVAFVLMPRGAAQSEAQACAVRMFEGSGFTVCRFEAGSDRLELAWKSAADGKAHRRLSILSREMGGKADKVRFAMNAGMFDAAGAPIGLYVEKGRTLKPLNRNKGGGNFHMTPNGVFWAGADGKVHVSTTGDYAKTKPKAQWATQSGPMLVIDGKLHPDFSHDGDSRHVRNGVGVLDANTALFVISEGEVSFGKLARFFRDELKTKNALYLDGAVSSLWAPGLNRLDAGRDIGPMVVVTAP